MEQVNELKRKLEEGLDILELSSKDVKEEAKLSQVTATKLHLEKALNLYEALKSVSQIEEDFQMFTKSATEALHFVQEDIKSFKRMKDERKESLEKSLRELDVASIKSIYDSMKVDTNNLIQYRNIIVEYFWTACRDGDLNGIKLFLDKNNCLGVVSDRYSGTYHSATLLGLLIQRSSLEYEKGNLDYLHDILEKGLLQAIESNQIFVIAFLLQMDFSPPDVRHARQVLPRFKTRRTKGHALAFKLKRREILKLFHPQRYDRDYDFYLACAECMNVEEFINTERELESHSLLDEINRLKLEVVTLRQEMAKLSIGS